MSFPAIPQAQAEIKMYEGIGEDYPNQRENPEIAKLCAADNAIQAAVAKAAIENGIAQNKNITSCRAYTRTFEEIILTE